MDGQIHLMYNLDECSLKVILAEEGLATQVDS